MDASCARPMALIASGQLSAKDLIATCEGLSGRARDADIASLYRTWLQANGNDGLVYAVRYNFGVVLNKLGDFAGANREFMTAIALKADFYPAYINAGATFERLGGTSDAVTQWLALVNLLKDVTGETVNYKLTVLKQIGRVLENTHLAEAGEDALRQVIEITPHPDAIQHWISIRQKHCKWPVLSHVENTSRNQLYEAMSPHCLVFHADDPLLHLARANEYYERKIGRPNVFFHQKFADPKKRPPGRRLRIAYLSSYFREHAHGYLTAELYGLHDRSKFEVFAYSCSQRSKDRIQQQIMRDVDHWVDIVEMSDEQAAQRIFDDEIDILIDFNGYTGDARPGIVAMRPAPVIINWLGYPGSMATPYHNYIIADDFVIPPEYDLYYSEKVLRLSCYQPNDRNRVVVDRTWTRQDAGLPAGATVFCGFNGVQKITAQMWTRFMTILSQVPDSVLWLLDGSEGANARLRAAAAECGIDPQRIIFAPKMINEEHLARYPLADLFLDTSPCGAHTTASDALWMGVPVLTMAGRGFAARVCGSLVTAAGLGELVTSSFEDYVSTAIAIGNDKALQAKYRSSLAANRSTCDLFNTEKHVAQLDHVLMAAWDQYVDGRNPIPDLTNLKYYNQVGTALDGEGVELISVPDYDELYRARLREFDVHTPLPADSRLWRRRS